MRRRESEARGDGHERDVHEVPVKRYRTCTVQGGASKMQRLETVTVSHSSRIVLQVLEEKTWKLDKFGYLYKFRIPVGPREILY
jgi:hypothetical protein